MSWLAETVLPQPNGTSTWTRNLRFHFEIASRRTRSARAFPRSKRAGSPGMEFGGIDQIKEDCRESRGTMWLDIDRCRMSATAFVSSATSPGFTLTAVITLALGIGATTAIFTLVHGSPRALASGGRSLPPLSHRRSGPLAAITTGFESDDGDFDLFPYDLYLDLKQSTPEFEQLAAR